jgi:lysophospholipase L1-like esterase
MIVGAWGDSITYGGPEEGWVGLLRKTLPSQETEVYNRGICGDTSDDILKRFSVEATAINPEVILFAVGTNDSKYPSGSTTNKISLSAFEQNMQQLISQAKARTTRVILIGLTDVNETEIETGSTFSNTEIKKYNESIKKLAANENLEFIDMGGVIDLQEDLEDGLHPNNKGYAKMFEIIFPLFK